MGLRLNEAKLLRSMRLYSCIWPSPWSKGTAVCGLDFQCCGLVSHAYLWAGIKRDTPTLEERHSYRAPYVLHSVMQEWCRSDTHRERRVLVRHVLGRHTERTAAASGVAEGGARLYLLADLTVHAAIYLIQIHPVKQKTHRSWRLELSDAAVYLVQIPATKHKYT